MLFRSALDVTNVNLVFVDANGGNIIIGGLTGGVVGQVVFLSITDHTNNVTLEHNEGDGTQKVMMHDSSDETLDNFGGWTLSFDGTYWYDVSHAKHV